MFRTSASGSESKGLDPDDAGGAGGVKVRVGLISFWCLDEWREDVVMIAGWRARC